MILKKKALPLQARKALGFRGAVGVRSCFICGITEENNFDKYGKLQQLRVVSRSKNLNDTRTGNHLFICARCKI